MVGIAPAGSNASEYLTWQEAQHKGAHMALACIVAGRVQAAAGQPEKALDAFQKARAEA